MPQIAQHQAAELWELGRDHLVGASTIRMMAQGVRDPQLRSTLERHALDFERAGHRIQQFLHEPGAGSAGGQPAGSAGYGDVGAPGFGQPAVHGSWSAQSMSHGTWAGPNSGYTARGTNLYDVTAAAACLDKCKSMAVKCVWGATETSQPARSYLHQLAGEHLRMAEEHYHWLERHGAYASPQADPAAVHDYAQKLRQFVQAGQQPSQEIASGYVPQAVAQGGPTATHMAPEYTQSGWSIAPGGMPYVTAGAGQQVVSTHHQPAWSSLGPGTAYGTGTGHDSGYGHRGESR